MSIKAHEYGCWGGRKNGNIFTLEDLSSEKAKTRETTSKKVPSSETPIKTRLVQKIVLYAKALLLGIGAALATFTFVAAAVAFPIQTVTILIMVTQALFAIILAVKFYRLIKGSSSNSCPSPNN